MSNTTLAEENPAAFHQTNNLVHGLTTPRAYDMSISSLEHDRRSGLPQSSENIPISFVGPWSYGCHFHPDYSWTEHNQHPWTGVHHFQNPLAVPTNFWISIFWSDLFCPFSYLLPMVLGLRLSANGTAISVPALPCGIWASRTRRCMGFWWMRLGSVWCVVTIESFLKAADWPCRYGSSN